MDNGAASAPNWKRFAALTYNAEVAAVLKALCDCDPPSHGRPRSFRAFDGDAVWAGVSVDGGFVVYRGGSSQAVNHGSEVLRVLQLPAGTPSGEALRQWLRWWGWTPRNAASAPADTTKMII